MIVLLLFGLAHSLLLWDGDILFFYGVVGLFLPLFRNCSNKVLLLWVLGLLLSPLLLDLIKVISNGKWKPGSFFLTQAMAADKQAGIDENNISTWLLTHSTYSDMLAWCRSGTWWSWNFRTESNRIPKVFAMFLLGLWVGRNKIYLQLQERRGLLKRVQLYGFIIGIPAGFAHAYFEFDKKSLPNAMGLLDTASYVLNVAPLGMAYVSTITLLFLKNSSLRIWHWLMPAGRMALTNYISQSLICVMIFHGIGWGLGGKVGPAVFIPLAIAVYVLQVLISNIWFRFFHFGPLEWIWRMLTYGRWLSIFRELKKV